MAVDSSAVPVVHLGLETGADLRRPGERGGAWDFFTRLIHARLAGLGLVIIVAFVLAAILAPLITHYSPTKQKVTNALKPPSAEYLLGTDELGRDTLSRVLYGGQVSLQVGIIAVGCAMFIGVALGLIAGYWSNSLLDQVVMRAMDALLAFPALVLALALVATLGASLQNVIIAVGVVADSLLAAITERISTVKVGAGMYRASEMGPLVTGAHRDRVASYIEMGRDEGATVIVDGREMAPAGDGFWLGSSLLDNVVP